MDFELTDKTHTLDKNNLRDNNPRYLVVHSTHSYPFFNQVLDCHLSNGWAGVGYHLFLDKQINLHQGRPFDLEGAHSLGFNTCSIGLGFYNPPEKMSSRKVEKIRKVVSHFSEKYSLKVVSHTEAQIMYMKTLLEDYGLHLEVPSAEDCTEPKIFDLINNRLEKIIGGLDTDRFCNLKDKLKSLKNCPGPIFGRLN